MDPFTAYSLPIQGLKVGVHRYRYALDQEFFRHFEASPVGESNLQAELLLDRRSDMMLLGFTIDGTVRAECDRCTAQIDLPVRGERELVVKYGEAEGEEEDEVVFIPRDAPEFNVAKYLYEFTVLALPISNTYDCQSGPNPPCNFEILKFLDNGSGADASGSVWDALKGLDANDN